MDTKTRFYAPLNKVEEQDDGTIKVYGIASTETVDSAGEIVKAEAVRAALPGYLEYPALREMHGHGVAAGTTIELEVGDDNITRIAAHVVDPIAVLKVRSGVYRGFSIGGRVTKRDSKSPKTITGITLSEISLVDRPAQSEAALTMWKVDGAEPRELDMAKSAEELTEIERTLRADAAVNLAKALKDAGITGEPDAEALAKAEADKVAAAEALAKTVEVKAVVSVEADTLAKTIADSVAKAAAVADTGDATIEAGAAKIEADAALAKAVPDGGTTFAPAVAELDPIAKATAKVDALAAVLEPATDGLAKGMYDVKALAEVLSSLSWIVLDSEFEADFEGDKSKVPAKLRAALTALAEAFKLMATEEVSELIGQGKTKKAAEAEAIAKAAGAGGLVDAVATEALAKATALADDLAKGLAARDEALTKLADRLDPLIKTVEDMKLRLAPPKAAGPGASLTKAADAAGGASVEAATQDDIATALSKMSDDEKTMTLTKAALKVPHVKSFR